MIVKETIAVLITCHNRRDKTLECLNVLYQCVLPDGYTFDVFLVDDGSTDDTTEAVNRNFPNVNVIQGDGNLYWNRGMRLAWETAADTKDYDFYLWLNDDVVLYKDGLKHIFDDYLNIQKKLHTSIIIGSILDPDLKKISYGGYINQKIIEPIGYPIECETFNGNVVLIPNSVYTKVGLLDFTFTHWFGDTDYGWRARNIGFKCYISSKYIGECSINEKGNEWANPNNSVIKRLKILHSSKGLPPKQWYVFSKRFYGNKWPISFIKLYTRALFPSLWEKIKKSIQKI